MNNINEIPKYRKKKNSSTSKAKEKAKHKHEYEDCLFITRGWDIPLKAEYCKICGKIGDIHFFNTVPCGNHCCRMMTAEEMYEKYKDLPIVHIDDITAKYTNK